MTMTEQKQDRIQGTGVIRRMQRNAWVLLLIGKLAMYAALVLVFLGGIELTQSTTLAGLILPLAFMAIAIMGEELATVQLLAKVPSMIVLSFTFMAAYIFFLTAIAYWHTAVSPILFFVVFAMAIITLIFGKLFS